MRKKMYTIVLTTIAICLAAQNALLIKENKKVRQQRDLAVDKIFRKGDPVREFGGVNIRGQFASVNFDDEDRGTILIGFSASCPASLANLPNLMRLSRAVDKNKWRVVWLTRDAHNRARDFFSRYGIKDEVLGELSCRNYNALGLRSVPRIVAVTPDGKVGTAWSGVLTQDVWDEIFLYFFVSKVNIRPSPPRQSSVLNQAVNRSPPARAF